VKGDGIHKAVDAAQPGMNTSVHNNPFEVPHPTDLGGKGFSYAGKGMDTSARLVGANGIQTVLPEAAPAA